MECNGILTKYQNQFFFFSIPLFIYALHTLLVDSIALAIKDLMVQNFLNKYFANILETESDRWLHVSRKKKIVQNVDICNTQKSLKSEKNFF